MDKHWNVAINGGVFSEVKVDGVGVCQCTAFITAFCMYFVFNVAYQPHLKNTLMMNDETDLPSEAHCHDVINLLLDLLIHMNRILVSPVV